MVPTKPIDPHKRVTKIDYNTGHTANSNGLTQAYILREIAAEHALELRECPAPTLEDKATRAQALRNVTSVWEVSSDRIRILRGKPLPGSLRPERKPTKKPRTRAIPSESPSDNSGGS